MQRDILEHLERHGTCFEEDSDLADVVKRVDVVYQTRIRPGRVRDRADIERYAINSALVQRMRPDAMVLHPLPRTVELDRAVDDDPRAQYFQQATNGLYVRMALLTMLWD
jgi:aspartate carbamoyltransferase catalytic subunit